MRKIILTIWAVFFLNGTSFGYSLFENDDFKLEGNSYFRTDLISFKNVVGLDSHNKDDRTTYLGIDYNSSFSLDLKKSSDKFFLKLERNGPYDYDAPLFIHRKLIVSGLSEIKAYGNEELLPDAEEFWWDAPLLSSQLRFKAGLFPYEAGKGFAAGTGSFENYGASLYYPGKDFSWRLHYFRPDLVNKTRLGPRIKQDEEQGIIGEPNAANYFTFDASFASGVNSFLPFASLLLDNTSPDKRTNLFAAPVHREVLGTLGLDYDLKINNLSFGFEGARNFGGAK